MSEITWQEPPPDPRGGRRYRPFMDALRERPGEWALLPFGPHWASTTTSIKRGRVAGAKAGEFDATFRHTDDPDRQRGDIYVRYVGDDGGAS